MTILLDDDKIVDRLMATMLFSGDSEDVLAPHEDDDVSLGDYSPFIIYDLFLTDLAGGSVDGTDCEPVGIRQVVDSHDFVSISGDALVFSNGNEDLTDPTCVFLTADDTGITRSAGLTIEVDVKIDVGEFWIGLNLDDTPGIWAAPGSVEYAIYFEDDNDIWGSENGAIWDTGENWVANTQYRLRFVMKAAGATIGISGGAFGTLGQDYTVLYDNVNLSTATLYVAIANHDGEFEIGRVIVY